MSFLMQSPKNLDVLSVIPFTLAKADPTEEVDGGSLELPRIFWFLTHSREHKSLSADGNTVGFSAFLTHIMESLVGNWTWSYFVIFFF